MGVIGRLVSEAAQAGVAAEKVALIGFSQGACLSLEFAYRNARRYGGIVGLSGALIGPPGGVRERTGSLEASPVYLGCSDRDVHIPLANIEETAALFSQMGARVTKSIFPGMGHTVNAEEIGFVRRLVQALAKGV